MNSHMDQSINGHFPITRLRVGLFQIGLILAVLYIISRYNYLLFHSLAEFIGAAIAFAVFMFAWNSRKFFVNNYYLFIGVAFLTVGIANILHGLSYHGMGVFADTAVNTNLTAQIWLVSQYILAGSFLIAPFFLKRKLNARTIFLSYTIVLVFFLLSIFEWKIFPAAYQEGFGVTAFEKISEYAVAAIFIISLYFFRRKRNLLDQRMLRLLSFILILFAVSTWLSTIDARIDDFFDILGHFVRILAFYTSYLAFIEYGLMRPYGSIFKELNENRLALELEKNKLTGILDNIEDGIYITDRQYEIIYANPALLRYFGAINGQKCYEYLHDRESACHWCKNTEVFEGKTMRWEWHYSQLGKTFDLIDSPLITTEGITAKIAIFRDITERKKTERAKDEFISLASHQLRTPLANIRLSSELMLRGLAGQNSPEQKGFLEEIHKATKRMGILVNNLLNISRIEMGNFDIKAEAIDISSSARSIAQEFAPLMAEKNIDYKISATEDAPVIYFDENVLRIIIENLLSNSLRYTPKGGVISFDLKKNSSALIIEVSDNGCGIPDHQKEDVFKKSFRTDVAKSLTSEGAGLGLYMVKSVCDKIGADIWFESEPRKGTTFYVSLPIEEDSQLRII